MSNIIDKISNKLQGNDDKTDSSDYNKNQHSGNQRSGQGQGRQNQQYSTGSNVDDDYNSGSLGQSNRAAGSENLGSRGAGSGTGVGNFEQQQGWSEDTIGSGRTGQEQGFASQQTRAVPGTRGSALDPQSQQQGAGSRQTRSQGSGLRDEAEAYGRQGVDRGAQEADKYVSRNL